MIQIKERLKRKSWSDRDGFNWQWDSQHGKLEKWNRRRTEHLGEFDPVTGKQTKKASLQEDGMVKTMEHGIRFINEYPEIGELLHRLFVNRELDEWYKSKCAEKIKVPDEFNQIKGLKKLKLEI